MSDSSTMSEVEQLWRFIPQPERERMEKIAALSGVSNGAALAMKMCTDALRTYCPKEERVKVAALVARMLVENDG